MKINNINYSQNFGLTEKENYLAIKDILIHNANLLGKKDEAKTIAKAIKKLLPEDILDYNKDNDKFILTLEKTNEQYDVGMADRIFPVKTLTSLYETLERFESGNIEGSGAKPLKAKL